MTSPAHSALFAAGFFTSPPVLQALATGALVSAVTALVGVFTVLRRQSFAGHALADLGAVGGSAAYLLGISQLWGFVGAGILAAGVMELIGIKRVQGRDVTTGIVFGAGLGLTALFLYWDSTIAGASNATISVLFGSIFVQKPETLPLVLALSVVACAIIVVIYRWLLVDALSGDLAAVRRIPVRLTGILFLVALALAVELSALTIGAVLSTALLIGPAAAAFKLTSRVGHAIIVAVLLGIASTWAGIVLSYNSYDWAGGGHTWPASFCIVAVVFVVYLVASAAGRLASARRGRARVGTSGRPERLGRRPADVR